MNAVFKKSFDLYLDNLYELAENLLNGTPDFLVIFMNLHRTLATLFTNKLC